MSSVQQNELQMLNQYIAALERQVKANQSERQNLLQQVAKAEQNSSKADIQLRQVKNQLKELNSVLSRQGVEKTNIQNKVKIVSDENDKLKRQGELKEQKITQLNNTIKQKNQLLAKEKNNVLLTNNYHSKAVGTMEEKLRDVQKKLNQTIQERNLLSYSVNQCNEQLTAQRQQNQKLKSKNGFCETYIETLQSKVKILEKEIVQTNDDKDLVNANLNRTNDDLAKARQEIQRLSMQLIHGNQSSEESKKSYENFINGLKMKYEQEIFQQKEQIQQHKLQIQQKKQSIESLNVLLGLQRANYQKEFQKSTELTEQLSQLSKEFQRVRRQMTDEIQSKNSIIYNQERQIQQLMAKWKETQTQLQKTLKSKYASQDELNMRLHEFEIRYDQDMREKEDQIDALNSKLTSKAIENEELKYDLSETRKRQNRLSEDLKKREEEIETLSINLQMKKQKIEDLSSELSDTYKQLQDRTKDYHDKGREGEVLNQKTSEMSSLIENLKKEIQLLTKLKEEKNLENKRLKTKVEGMSQQLSQLKKTQARLNKQIQDNQQKLSKTLEDFTNTKQGSDKRLAQTLKRLNEVDRQLQKLKKDFKEKQDLLKMLTLEYEHKTKEFAGKEQDMSKKLIEIESKHGRLVIKLNEQQKQMQKREQDFNKAIQKLVGQHTNENHDLNKRYETQIKELQTKYFQQTTKLNKEIQFKLNTIKQLQNQLSKHQMSSVQFSSSQSSMQKTIAMLQKELQQTHKQVNSYHEKLFAFNNAADNTKEQIIEKDIKIISLTALLEKARKDNERLLNEEILLREQVAALESSTTYLKKQLTSTLDRQQTSLKEIRTLQQANKSFSKLISSTSSSNLIAIGERLNSSRNIEKKKSMISLSGEFKAFDNKNESIPDSIVEEPVQIAGSQKKRENKVQHKYSKPESNTSIDSIKKGTETKSITFGKDSQDITQFINDAINNSLGNVAVFK